MAHPAVPVSTSSGASTELTPLRIDPQLQEALTALGVDTMLTGMQPGDIAAQRDRTESMTPSLEQLRADERFTVTEQRVPGPAGDPDVPIVIATPRGRATRCPVIVTTHGGGLILGSSRLGLPAVLDVGADLGAVVVSVEYRLAPEHPFPAAHHDAWAALLWVAAHVDALGGDPNRILLYGGSAGATLAAGLALRARRDGDPDLCGLVLLYPMLDDRTDTASAHQMHGRGVWDDVTNRTAWAAVLDPEHAGAAAPSEFAAPARARSLAGLPPTYLEVGSAETFRDEVVSFARRLWQDGGDAELHVWPGAFHGFDLFVPDSQVARRARRTRREWLHRLLGA